MRIFLIFRAIANGALVALLVIMALQQLAQIHLFECATLLGIAMVVVNQEMNRLEK